MKKLFLLILFYGLISRPLQSQNINFSSEYDRITWPTSLSVGGGLTGDDGSYKRLALFHGHSISLQTGSNLPGIANSRLFINSLGQVGIGTTAPVSKLHIAGGGLTLGTNIFGASSDGQLSLGNISRSYTPTSWTNGAEQTTLLLTAQDYATIGFNDFENRMDVIRVGNGTIDLGYDGGWGRANIGFTNGIWRSDGNVGIGTTNPGTYKLAVEGKIGAREVEVKTGSWADFVFQPDYKLRPLSEVASYVSAHHHLPEIPSETEVKANGIGLGEMNVKLLQKIEELTLYSIQLEKNSQQQRAEIDELKQLVKQLLKKK